MKRHSHKKFWLAIVILAIVAVIFFVDTAWVLRELNETQNTLRLRESELETVQTQWADAEAELSETQNTLRRVESELETAQTQWAEAKAELATVKIELSTATERIESLEATLSNLQVHYARLTTGYGYVLRPSYQEMREFLARDKIDEREYIMDEYECRHFAADVKANAAKERIWAAYVLIEFPVEAHAIVAFLTTDRGLIFVEPQTDEISNLVIGRSYWESVGRLRPTDYDDTVIRITKIW
jgi:multidrug resistance efflux pump